MPVIEVIELEAMSLQVKTIYQSYVATPMPQSTSDSQFNEHVHRGNSGRECRDAVGAQIPTKHASEEEQRS